MKKRNILPLALALALAPAAGSAQDLPELFTGVYQSIGEGLAQGAALAQGSMAEELTLTLETDGARVEEGRTVGLTVTAGNPMAAPVDVTITLDLPERLRASGETTFTATLPAAQLDEESGKLLPSTTAFTRSLALAPGGGSETVELTSEMSMGTRFYRASAPLALCVPDIEVTAFADGAQRLQPGDAFAYRIEVKNSGDAPKDVALEMTLPKGVTIAQLPDGLAQEAGKVRGVVHAAPAGAQATCVSLSLPMTVDEDALAGDADAYRLMAGLLRADGERVALPRLEVCDALIHAQMTAATNRLAVGEETTLCVTLVNGGLVPADVRLSCMLPQGLSLSGDKAERAKEATAAEMEGAPTDGNDLPGGNAAVPAQLPAAAPAEEAQGRMLTYDLHIDAAKQTDKGVVAATKTLQIPVVADVPQAKLDEQMLGASLQWSVNDEAAQLGDAVAMRVVRAEFLGMSRAEWNGMFWAGVLMLATVICLSAAVRRDRREEDFCCD